MSRGQGSQGAGTVWGELARQARLSRGALLRIVAWSLLESAPVLVLGVLVAASSAHFLAAEMVDGLTALVLLMGASLVGSAAHRQVYPWLAEVVEPLRDTLVRDVVRGTVGDLAAAGGRPDAAAVARVATQVQVVRNILFTLLQSLRQTVFALVATVAGLFLLAPVAAMLAVACLAGAAVLFLSLLPRLATRYRAAVRAEEVVATEADWALNGVRDAVALGAEDRAGRPVTRAVEVEADRSRAVGRGSAARVGVVFVGGQLPTLILLSLAPTLIGSGRLTTPELVGATTYFLVSLEPGLRALVGIVGSLGLECFVTLERLVQVSPTLDEPSSTPAPLVRAADRQTRNHPGGGRHSSRGYDIDLSRVRFSYGPDAAPVVQDLTLHVPEGDHVALLGPSGIGKSTLVDLIAGVLSPDAGRVRIGAVDSDRLLADGHRDVLAVVPQESYVFAGTLRDNLSYLGHGATDCQLEASADAIGLLSTLRRLGGLDARIGAGGAALSAGERQLVVLARVHASTARIVILDEATCHLDPAAERRAEQALAERPGTLIVVAHRISSGLRAGRILLLDGDQAVVGTHDELLLRSKLYADLVGHWSSWTPGCSLTSSAG